MKRRELIEAIEAANDAIATILDNWEGDDLAGAIRNAAEVKESYLKPALDWWESDE